MNTMSRLMKLEARVRTLPRRQTRTEAVANLAQHVYGSVNHPAAARVLADPDDPELYRDLVIDSQWRWLDVHAGGEPPLDVWPTNGHSLTASQKYSILRSRIWLCKAHPDWPDPRIRHSQGLNSLFPFLRRPGETYTECVRRHFDYADGEPDDVEPEDEETLDLTGPLLLPGERWPMSWPQAYWRAAQEDGLYLAARGFDVKPPDIQAIRALAGVVEARGFGELWTNKGTIRR